MQSTHHLVGVVDATMPNSPHSHTMLCWHGSLSYVASECTCEGALNEAEKKGNQSEISALDQFGFPHFCKNCLCEYTHPTE